MLVLRSGDLDILLSSQGPGNRSSASYCANCRVFLFCPFFDVKFTVIWQVIRVAQEGALGCSVYFSNSWLVGFIYIVRIYNAPSSSNMDFKTVLFGWPH